MKYFYLYFMVVCFYNSPCLASNNYFLPGDAFFHTFLIEKDSERLAPENLVFVAERPYPNFATFSGYAGYRYLNLIRSPDTAIKGLQKAYAEMKPIIDRNAERDAGCLSVFVYNKSFDWKQNRLAFQYNENWESGLHDFGYTFEEPRHEFFTKVTDEDWKSAPHIAPLTVDMPTIQENLQGSWSKSPLVMKTDYQLIVLPNRDYNAYYHRRDGSRLFVITDKSAIEYVADRGDWKPASDPLMEEKYRNFTPVDTRDQKRDSTGLKLLSHTLKSPLFQTLSLLIATGFLYWFAEKKLMR